MFKYFTSKGTGAIKHGYIALNTQEKGIFCNNRNEKRFQISLQDHFIKVHANKGMYSFLDT